MQDLGKLLVIVGLLIAVSGAWLWSGRGFGWLGRLPGDISYQNGDWRTLVEPLPSISLNQKSLSAPLLTIKMEGTLWRVR